MNKNPLVSTAPRLETAGYQILPVTIQVRRQRQAACHTCFSQAKSCPKSQGEEMPTFSRHHFFRLRNARGACADTVTTFAVPKHSSHWSKVLIKHADLSPVAKKPHFLGQRETFGEERNRGGGGGAPSQPSCHCSANLPEKQIII